MTDILSALRELTAQHWGQPSTHDLAVRAGLSRPAAAALLCQAAEAGIVVRVRYPRSPQWGPRCSAWRVA